MRVERREKMMDRSADGPSSFLVVDEELLVLLPARIEGMEGVASVMTTGDDFFDEDLEGGEEGDGTEVSCRCF